MSTKRFCDKCDGEMAIGDELYVMKVPDEHVSNTFKPVELCRGCLRRLNDWLRHEDDHE